jgi:hypothetical protein
LRKSLWDFLLLFGHIEDLKHVLDVQVIEVQRLQYDLTDHEVDILDLQLYLFEKVVEIFLWDSVFSVPPVCQGLMDVLLVICDQLCDLDKHLVLFWLRNQLILPYQFDEIFFDGFSFECLPLLNLDVSRRFFKAQLI